MGITQETCTHFPALPGSIIAHGSAAVIIMCNEETFPPPHIKKTTENRSLSLFRTQQWLIFEIAFLSTHYKARPLLKHTS